MSTNETVGELEKMWAAHRAFLRRLLISMARDIDLAEDLLQDTYVRACTGFSGYRGGDERAWLSAVARTTFLSHARRKYYSRERHELSDEQADGRAHPGSGDHLDLLSVRQAVSDLDPRLRKVLILKHYAGLTYDEIGAEIGCAAGTVKWQVNQAVGEIRSMLGISSGPQSAPGRLCAQISILDHLYACLPPDESAKVDAHIQTCPFCEAAADEMRSVLTSLDHIEGDLKMMHTVEINRQGIARLYVTMSALNLTQEPWDSAGFGVTERGRLLHWIVEGEEAKYERVRDGSEPYRIDYSAPLRTPVKPGEWIEQLMVFSIPRSRACAVPHGDGFRFEWDQMPSREDEFAYVQAIRLPRKAELTRAEPEPHEVRTRGTHTTVVWRRVLAPHERFRCAVEYSQGK